MHGTTPKVPASLALRWTRWQQSRVAQAYLTPRAAAHGYTVLKVPPESTAAFFVLADLFLARARYERATETGSRDAQAEAAWREWQTWTRRLAAYLDRRAQGTDGTCPPLPDALKELADA
jgi:hypothetical protein